MQQMHRPTAPQLGGSSRVGLMSSAIGGPVHPLGAKHSCTLIISTRSRPICAATSGPRMWSSSRPPHPTLPASTTSSSRRMGRTAAALGHSRLRCASSHAADSSPADASEGALDRLGSDQGADTLAVPGSSLAPEQASTGASTVPDTLTCPIGSGSWPSRRLIGATALLAASGGVLGSGLGFTPPAHALKQVTLRDGSVVDVFEHGMSLNIVALKGSIPSDWILHYKTMLGKYAGFTIGQRDQISDIFKELSDPAGTKNSASVADVISLGDAWLGPAIKKGQLQPIPNAQNSRWWRALSPRWQSLLRRDAAGMQDPKGDVYAAPYRWGCTLIAYRKDRLLSRGGKPVSDWCDLLQPQLEQRVAMTESVREFMGAAIKAALPTDVEHVSKGTPATSARARVGYNTCATALAARGVGAEEVTRAAQALRKQVKLFSNRDHVRAFGAGDVWAVVGWARDIITLAERSNNVEVLVPASGTALFADVWAVPHGATGGHMQTGPSPLLPSWLDFCTTPARMANLDNLKSGALPLLLDHYQPDDPLPDGDHEGLVLTYANGFMPRSTGCLARSEFLLPLDAPTLKLYKDVLEGMKSSSSSSSGSPAGLFN